MFHNRILAVLTLIVAIASPVWAQNPSTALGAGEKWVATWAASVHGPYPAGNASAQPDLKFAFPDAAQGAVDQSFRLIVKPDLWGDRVRIRLANTFGTHAIAIDHIYVGVAASGGNIVKGTNRPVLFSGRPSVSLSPGVSSYSDAVDLQLPSGALTEGRKLAISFHVAGPTGPMTWHAKALQTSYLSGHRSGSHTKSEDDAAFPYTTTSWYFLDAVDVVAPADTVVVCAFGDSITDGTLSTLNGDDRWPDANARRQAVNTFIRTGGTFDAVADFDAATVDPKTGALREEFVPNSTIGGAGDRLHPNRAGYQAMGSAVDLKIFAPAR